MKLGFDGRDVTSGLPWRHIRVTRWHHHWRWPDDGTRTDGHLRVPDDVTSRNRASGLPDWRRHYNANLDSGTLTHDRCRSHPSPSRVDQGATGRFEESNLSTIHGWNFLRLAKLTCRCMHFTIELFVITDWCCIRMKKDSSLYISISNNIAMQSYLYNNAYRLNNLDLWESNICMDLHLNHVNYCVMNRLCFDKFECYKKHSK